MIHVAPILAVVGTLAYLRATSTRQRIIRAARRVVPLKREHAIHKIVSQGRAFNKGYSGCGDLWNYVLDVAGAPNEWVNRDSQRRGLKWVPAVNISKPWGAALRSGAAIKFKKGGSFPRAGDLILIGQEPQEIAHVLVALKKIGPRRYVTAEYGGGSNAGVLGKREFDQNGITRDSLGPRHLVGWIDADKIPVDSRFRPRIYQSLLHLSKPERKLGA
jgi:hypothetical protein